MLSSHRLLLLTSLGAASLLFPTQQSLAQEELAAVNPATDSVTLPAPVAKATASKDELPEVVAPSAKASAAATKAVTTNVHITASADASLNSEGYERQITTQEIEQSAGTFGDPARFLQMLPGVVSDNDERNDAIVRGGNPSETLFVIDNIEMPSINQLALSDTTGGFVSMIDNAAVTHFTLHTDAYDDKFDQRLSAVMEISTRPDGPVEKHTNYEFGIGGAGFSEQRPVGNDGSMFFSVRRSVLNLFTKDIGMNGVPIYNNGLIRFEGHHGTNDTWWGLSLTGIDSMKIRPSATDAWETNPYDVDYSGWRNTTGINWQHVYSSRAFSLLTISNSEQQQTVGENAQLLGGASVYSENSHDGNTIVKYDWSFQQSPWLTWTAGARSGANRMYYNVQQPIGLQNPYSSDPAPMDVMGMVRKHGTGSSAAYGQALLNLPHGMRIIAGIRAEQWSLVQRSSVTPKVVFFVPLGHSGVMLHAGYAEYAQLPPTLYILAYNNQNGIGPIRAKHLTAGFDLVNTQHLRISLNGYEKLYSDYPVSEEYPQLSMANIADTFGQAFLMFPMRSAGSGIARGVESSVQWKPAHRLLLESAVTYMRSWYSGLDGVLRKSNFDIPLVANFSGNTMLGKGWTASFRYSGATGRPYTPDNWNESIAQNRDVYDLSQLNSLRADAYRRLDLRGEWTHKLHGSVMKMHIGLENALGTSNFYQNQWRPICQIAFGQVCGPLRQDQMPRFPDGGISFSY